MMANKVPFSGIRKDPRSAAKGLKEPGGPSESLWVWDQTRHTHKTKGELKFAAHSTLQTARVLSVQFGNLRC